MLMVNWRPVTVELTAPPPKPPFARRPRLREVDCLKPQPRDSRPCGNGMYDQRVRRGSNFARPPPDTTSSTRTSAVMQRKFREARRRLQRRLKLNADIGGLLHAAIQCEPFPEEAAEPETRSLAVQVTTQTDLTPGHPRLLQDAYLPAVKCNTGVDVSTQVACRDLIGFETEATPLAEALMARTLEEAAVQVLYEDDAAASLREQAVYESKRRAERVELHRLEQAEIARRNHGLRLLAKAERADPGPAFQAIYSRAVAVQYMASLPADALGQLEAAGYLIDDNQLTTWLYKQLGGHCQLHSDAGAFLDALIGDVIVNRPCVFREIVEQRTIENVKPPEREV